MTYILVPRSDEDSLDSASFAVAEAEEPFASDVSRWERFFDLVGSRRSERPKVWTSAGLARLAGSGIENDLSDWGYEPSHGVWKPDLCARGDCIYSAGFGEAYVSEPGTSMAAPVGAGMPDLSGV